jgi:hypothetical protein
MEPLKEGMHSFTDEIEGRLEKRKIFGVPMTRRITIPLCGVFVLAVVILGSILGAAMKGGGSSSSAAVTSTVDDNDHSKLPDDDNTRIEALTAMIEPLAGSKVTKDGTPQRKAIQWLAFTDTARLPLDTTPLDEIIQRYTFVTTYYATGGDDWKVNYNFLSGANICEWHNKNGDEGITCNEKGYATMLKLGDMNLTGTIPDDVGLLSSLTTLNLEGNLLRGTFPTEIGFLTNLGYITLRKCRLHLAVVCCIVCVVLALHIQQKIFSLFPLNAF